MTTGDKLWSDNNGRVEMQLDGSLIRISSNTGFSFLNLGDQVTQVQLTAGTLLVRVRRLDENETYEIDTPNLAFSILRPGNYRLSVNEAGDATAVKVRSGEGEVTGGGTAYAIHPNESATFTGTDQLAVNADEYGDDEFDTWSASRDSHWEHSASSRYVSEDVVGYEDLDDHGTWRQTEYGNVWFPHTSEPDWAPYHYGHWAYIEPWGYTWVDDEPWGYAPFHYGRWVSMDGQWGWVPCPPRSAGASYVRPVYAPALVAWVGGAGAAGVAWFALGPREVYVPSYRVSRNYVNNVNVSNTTVNTTVVNNYYNSTILNKNVSVTNIKYVNQTVPGAVAATSSQAFTTAQPVARNAVKVDPRAMASAPVAVMAPAVAPSKQAVLGAQRAATVKPPAAVQSRPVVAKVAPPPPPPPFEKRQEAIKTNGGQPLSTAQLHQIQPAIAPRPGVVKMAPPAKPAPIPSATSNKAPEAQPNTSNKPGQVETARPGQPAPQENRPNDHRPASTNSQPTAKAATPNSATQPPNRTDRPPTVSNSAPPPVQPNTREQPQNRPSDRPTNQYNSARPPEVNRPAATAVHPNELPPVARPSTPNAGNTHLQQKQQQEQEQLRLRQEQERQKVQQQQELEHQRAAQKKMDEANRQQQERQHQQQTQQLQQKHEQEQQQLREKQQQEAKNPPKPAPKEDRPPKPQM
jgi:hypothetical protein